MLNESTKLFSSLPFRVIQSGPWDPSSFGIVKVSVIVTDEGLEAVIDTEPQIRLAIDGYEMAGGLLYLRTNASRKWVFRALD